MTGRRTHFHVMGFLACASMLLTAAPVAAECTQLDPWPSFTAAAPSAQRIVVGEVVHSFRDDSADNAIEFRVRVDEVLRGEGAAGLDFRGGTRSGAPSTVCGDSILRVHVGDVLAFAFDARIESAPGPVLAVAWVRGIPDDFLMPGAETLSLGRVHELAPPTVDRPLSSGEPDPAELPLVPVAIAGILLSVLLLGSVPLFRRRVRPS